ncbi:MAG: hypothetical protein PHH14_01905 [Candidatus Margulisbacteria bacterium]|nr:hypothetical protein [Candidatus Margulisiibacteriota bacterium]
MTEIKFYPQVTAKDLKAIKEQKEIKDEFIKKDLDGDGRVMSYEANEYAEKYGTQKRKGNIAETFKSVELWEYMEAVNKNEGYRVFQQIEIETNIEAYQTLRKLNEKINKNYCYVPASYRWRPGLWGTSVNGTIIIELLARSARNKIDENYIIETIYKLLCEENEFNLQINTEARMNGLFNLLNRNASANEIIKTFDALKNYSDDKFNKEAAQTYESIQEEEAATNKLPQDWRERAPKHLKLAVKLLANNWPPEEIGRILTFAQIVSTKLNENETKEFSQLLEKASEGLAQKERYIIYSNTAKILLNNNAYSKNIIDNFYVSWFTWALSNSCIEGAGLNDCFLGPAYAKWIIDDYIAPLNTENGKLNILKNLAKSDKFEIKFTSGKTLGLIYEIGGITIIAKNRRDLNAAVIPGRAKLAPNQIAVEYFNRKNIDVVFEDPIKTLSASDALYKATNILPEELFQSFDREKKLRVVFKEINEGVEASWAGIYPPNTVIVNTRHGAAIGTITHELAHHWDLNLSVGYSGNQGTLGDLSLLFYRISWTPERIAREVWPPAAEKVAPNRQGFDQGDFIVFGVRQSLWNRGEDFACYFTEYAMQGQPWAYVLRKTIRDRMKHGNFELAAKYLFIKYLTPFKGREYNLSEKDPALTFEEVEAAIKAAADTSATDPETFKIIAEIKAEWKKISAR